MSFLNSVLNSISDGKKPIAIPQVRPSKPEARSGAQANDKATPSSTTKRKASSELNRPTDKLQKPSSTLSDKNVSERPKGQMPGGGTQSVTGQKPAAAVAAALAGSAKPAPKKGSFQEIMARSANAAHVGHLTHKAEPKQRLSVKKELLLQKELARQNKKGGRAHPSKPGSDVKAAASIKGRPERTSWSKEKVVKLATSEGTAKQKPQPSYQGTAKPKPSTSYTGTAKSGNKTQRNREYDSEPDQERSKPFASKHKRSYSEADSEEEESENGYDYASEDYSDMDAGFDDVDEEEAEAERQAKKEDLREQRRLDELAREKAQRKKKAQEEAERAKTMKR